VHPVDKEKASKLNESLDVKNRRKYKNLPHFNRNFYDSEHFEIDMSIKDMQDLQQYEKPIGQSGLEVKRYQLISKLQHLKRQVD
jgi:hypothetical protein